MRLTTKGRYAVTAMLDLALHADSGPTSLGDISQRQEISLSYLEQLFARLRRAGLVNSVRGPGGGYLLSQPPEAISVSKVIDAVNESVDATRCQGLSDCQQGNTCLTHHLWCELSVQIRHFLDDMTLAQLMLRPDVIRIASRQQSRQQQRAEAGILASSP
ncbi:Fe-S cluster assembly transcriptional regulator IscR [Halovibrio variabilis]|nr:Fe-S cluster assembly transcriptional regulator IscR [Halovibrio variabilis]